MKRPRESSQHTSGGGLVTESELATMVMEEACDTNTALAARGEAPAGAPAWAAPIFAQLAVLTPLVPMVQTLQNDVQNIAARQANSMVDDGLDPLQPIHNHAVPPVVAPGFPATWTL